VAEGEFDAYTGSMASADTDGDGSVSQDELAGYQSTYGGSGDIADLDLNGDSEVTEEELDAYTGSMSSADADGDDKLSQAELDNYQTTYGGSGTFASLDRNKDGNVSKAEFDAHTGSMASADTDGDGSVSQDELTGYQSTYGGSGNASSLDSDGDGGLSKDEFDAYTRSLASADSDGDGSVSAAELNVYDLVYGGNGSFASVDLDGNGRISETEFRAYAETSPLCGAGFTSRWAGSTLAGAVGQAGFVDGSAETARFQYGYLSYVPSLAYSPDGTFLALFDVRNYALRLIDASTGLTTTLAGGANGYQDGHGTTAKFWEATSLSFSPDGSFMLLRDGRQSNSYIRKVTMYGLVTTLRRRTDSTDITVDGACAVSVAPEGSQYAVVERIQDSGRQMRVVLYNMTGGNGKSLLYGQGNLSDGGIDSADFGVWDLDAPHELLASGSRIIRAGSLAFSPDGASLVLADNPNHAVRLITVATSTTTTIGGSGIASYQDGTRSGFWYPISASWSPDGAFVVVADQNGMAIRLITVATASTVTLAGGSNSLFGTNFDDPVMLSTSQVTSVAFDTARAPGTLTIAMADQNKRVVRQIQGPECVPMSSMHASEFQTANKNGDGCVSAGELAEYQSTYGGNTSLASIDTDGDGCVSEDEWDAYTGSMGSVDTSGDGCVSAGELAEYQSTYGGNTSLASIDTDGDGCVSEEEWDAYTGSMGSVEGDEDGCG